MTIEEVIDRTESDLKSRIQAAQNNERHHRIIADHHEHTRMELEAALMHLQRQREKAKLAEPPKQPKSLQVEILEELI